MHIQAQKRRSWNRSSLWRRLTQPARSIREPERRRRAQLLSALLVIIIPLALLAILLTLADPRVAFTQAPLIVAMLGTVLALVLAYRLSRTIHYDIAALITVGAVFSAIFVTAYIDVTNVSLHYLLIVIVMSSVFFSRRGTVVVLLITLLGTFLLAGISKELDWWDAVDALYLIIAVGALVLVSATLQKRDLEQIELQSGALSSSEKRFRLLIDKSSDLIFLAEPQGTIIFASPATTRILGYPVDEFVGRNGFDGVHPDDRLEIRGEVERLVALPGMVTTVEVRYRHKNGAWVWLEATGTNLTAEPGVRALLFNLRDITERKQSEQVLLRAHEELELRVRQRTAELVHANDELQTEITTRKQVEKQLGTTVIELAQRNNEITLLNEMGETLQSCQTIQEASDVIARYALQLFPNTSGALYLAVPGHTRVETAGVWGATPPGAHSFEPDGCIALRRGRVYRVTDPENDPLCRHVPPLVPAHSMCVPLVAQRETLGILHLVGDSRGQPNAGGSARPEPLIEPHLAVTVAERIALALANLNLRQELREQAIRDPLTNLYNRRYMEETLERELARAVRRQMSLGVIMLDIDHFKNWNDTFGHPAGDAVLRELGIYLQANIRGEDIACRYGGEEFIILLPEASLDDTVKRAEQIRLGVRGLRVMYQERVLGTITISVGVALFPANGVTLDAVLQAVDGALYRAKGEGRDRVAVAVETVG